MNEYISQQSCRNKSCSNYGKNDKKSISVHDKKQDRLRCKLCGKTWSAHYKEFHYGLHTDLTKIRRAIDMIRAEIPIRKIARLIDVSAGTVMRWKKKLSKQ
ncbi:hypothetical protein KJ742_07420 [Patescibacteria group bacterium]|nr:hypothetical protein [Patescibacteria group bacterium]MBU1683740.1 hypothetical protein [Patescibacteria group bacterium]MBU1934903.1 hypothetical protein [Patescibacteria group bacterium]